MRLAEAFGDSDELVDSSGAGSRQHLVRPDLCRCVTVTLTRFCWTSFASLNVCHCEATAQAPDDFDYRPQGAPVCLLQLGTATLMEFSERERARYFSKIGNFRDEYPL